MTVIEPVRCEVRVGLLSRRCRNIAVATGEVSVTVGLQSGPYQQAYCAEHAAERASREARQRLQEAAKDALPSVIDWAQDGKQAT